MKGERQQNDSRSPPARWSCNPAPDVVREDDPATWLGGFDDRVGH